MIWPLQWQLKVVNLSLNVFEPVIVQSLFESIEMLKNGMMTLKVRCIDGITANVG